MGAALVGAMAGATVALLSNKDNRKKLKEGFDELVSVGEDKIDEAKDKVDELKKNGKRKLVAGLEKAKEELDETNTGVARKTGQVRRAVSSV